MDISVWGIHSNIKQTFILIWLLSDVELHFMTLGHCFWSYLILLPWSYQCTWHVWTTRVTLFVIPWFLFLITAQLTTDCDSLTFEILADNKREENMSALILTGSRLTFMKKSVGGKIPRQMERRIQPCVRLFLFLLFTSCLQIWQ